MTAPQAWPAPQARPAPQASPWGSLELSAVLLLTVGTFVVPVVGPVVGLVLAWVSEHWTRREKIVASVLTLLPLLAVVLVVSSVVLVRADVSQTNEPLTPEPAVVTAPAVTP